MDPIKATRKLPRVGSRRSANPGAFLVHIYPAGPSLGSRYALHAAPVVIGRDDSCDIAVPDSSVSRMHARIELRADGYHLVDLGSTNGTSVNGDPASERKLDDGDTLQVGDCIYRFLVSGNVEAEYHEAIHRLTTLDALTGVYNKRYLLEFLDRELGRPIVSRRPLALLLLDIDHFKTVNDTLGHLAGDGALREVAACIRASMRREEVLARYGGEEFAVALPDTGRSGALQLAERIRRRVEAHALEHQGAPYRVTLSVGVAVSGVPEGETSAALIQRADERLYEAKRAGRNCVRG